MTVDDPAVDSGPQTASGDVDEISHRVRQQGARLVRLQERLRHLQDQVHDHYGGSSPAHHVHSRPRKAGRSRGGRADGTLPDAADGTTAHAGGGDPGHEHIDNSD